MNNLEEIRRKSREYDRNYLKTVSAERTKRFKDLVNTYGASAVSAATELKESTVVQYMRCKTVPVGENTIRKAETVLSSM